MVVKTEFFNRFMETRAFKILEESKEAIKRIKREDLAAIFIDSFNIVIKNRIVYITKVAKKGIYSISSNFIYMIKLLKKDNCNILKDLSRKKLTDTKEYLQKGYYKIKDKENRKNIYLKAKETFNLKKEEMEKIIQNLKEIPFREKKRIITETIFYGLVLFASFLFFAGGMDLEGGTPDLDIAVARIINYRNRLKFHRNVITHTIIMALGIEFVLRVLFNAVRVVYRYLPEKHDKFWDLSIKYTDNIEKFTVAGAYLGISAHLLKDSSLLKGFSARTKSVIGLPAVSDNAHQIFLGGNALLSAVIAKEEIVKK